MVMLSVLELFRVPKGLGLQGPSLKNAGGPALQDGNFGTLGLHGFTLGLD